MTLFSYSADIQTGLRKTLCPDIFSGFDAFEDFAEGAYLIACETADFHWEARVQERYLGEYERDDDDWGAYHRIAIMGFLQGCWFVATAIVDGDGAIHELKSLKHFERISVANRAFQHVR